MGTPSLFEIQTIMMLHIVSFLIDFVFSNCFASVSAELCYNNRSFHERIRTIMKKYMIGAFLTIGLGALLFFFYQENQYTQQHEDFLPIFEKTVGQSPGYKASSWREKRSIRRQVLEDIERLDKMGWSKTTIQKGYLETLGDISDNQEPMAQKLQEAYEDTLLIGQSGFMDLWNADMEDVSPLAAQNRLQVLMNYIHFPKKLVQDPKEIEHLLRAFSPQLSPIDPFWQDLADTVQAAFPLGTLAHDGKLQKQTHQLRYLISAQQVQWVRDNFRSAQEDDRTALAKYLATLKEDDYNLNESSRLHNKLATIDNGKKSDQEAQYADDISQNNFKVVLHFHAEFNLSENGKFLNKIDPEDTNENGIVNGASFNYADKNDAVHQQLDVDPVKLHDPKFIVKETDNETVHANEKEASDFESPSKKEESDENNDIYSRAGQSSEELTEKAAAEFKSLIEQYRQEQ
ncbi:DUF3114 domain-containing protein [Streptococcus sp. X16XC17]|nr:DUF3114 domain-containing protein [Streptococcus sp. X16XC17]